MMRSAPAFLFVQVDSRGARDLNRASRIHDDCACAYFEHDLLRGFQLNTVFRGGHLDTACLGGDLNVPFNRFRMIAVHVLNTVFSDAGRFTSADQFHNSVIT